MKKLRLVVLLLLLNVFAFAQPDLEKVTARQAEFNAALMSADSVTLDRLTADSLSYGHSAWKIESKKAFFEDILHSGARLGNIEVSSQTVSLAGDNAIIRQIFTADLTSSGQVTKLKLGVLLVWTKHKGNWKLLARQAVKIT